MSKVDEKKEYIGILKSYLGVLVAMIMAVGAGVSKLYLAKTINILFWLGLSLIFVCVLLFLFIARKTHKEIEKLRDLKD